MRTLITMLLTTISLYCAAQGESISFNGTVTNEKGELITGGIVELRIDGKPITGSPTNFNGQYSFTVTEKEDYTLVINSLGYLEQQFSINKDSIKEINTINKQLVVDNNPSNRISFRRFPCEPRELDTLPTRNTGTLEPDLIPTQPVKSVEASDRDYVPYRNTNDIISTVPGVLPIR